MLIFQTDFCEKFEIAAVQKDANLAELEKCCQTNIFLQNFVLVQPRTSPPKNLAILLTLTPNQGRRRPAPAQVQLRGRLLPDGGLPPAGDGVRRGPRRRRAPGPRGRPVRGVPGPGTWHDVCSDQIHRNFAEMCRSFPKT